ncbi:MAG: hypothetical protein A3D95_05815 [Betaproteobacteria bacterium RIFCSPHIGHO2_12_FULL_69_13]|nr:MAG: hypothetical protein A3D95_05815 [Betaproteobacteria bacterium RIFCSPHIGHO2_12_FULL_69_13]
MNVNEPEAKAGLPGVLRAIGAIAVTIVALIGVLVVLEVIPREALQEWFTKLGLIAAIVVAAAVALALLMRTGGKS